MLLQKTSNLTAFSVFSLPVIQVPTNAFADLKCTGRNRSQTPATPTRPMHKVNKTKGLCNVCINLITSYSHPGVILKCLIK